MLDPSLAYVNNADSMTFYTQEIIIDPLEHMDVGTYMCGYSIGAVKSLVATYPLQNVRLNETDPFIENVDFQGHAVISVNPSHGKKVISAISGL